MSCPLIIEQFMSVMYWIQFASVIVFQLVLYFASWRKEHWSTNEKHFTTVSPDLFHDRLVIQKENCVWAYSNRSYQICVCHRVVKYVWRSLEVKQLHVFVIEQLNVKSATHTNGIYLYFRWFMPTFRDVVSTFYYLLPVNVTSLM